jgi:hypothetical protein
MDSVDIEIAMEVTDWKDVERREMVVPVQGCPELCVALETFVWFGEEENWGGGDTDYSDVFLGLSVGLEADGSTCLSYITVPGQPAAGWNCEPAIGTPSSYHNLSRSVSGSLGRFAYHLSLKQLQ